MVALSALVVDGLTLIDGSCLSRAEVHQVVVAILAVLFHSGPLSLVLLNSLVHPVLTLRESHLGDDFALID